MPDLLEKVCNTIRRMKDPSATWQSIIKSCAAAHPSETWSKLPKPDVARDLKAATRWLSTELAAHPDATGIYLGLDTLNMESGPKKNIEIGFSTSAEPKKLDQEFLHDLTFYGQGHLVESLRDMKRVYDDSDIFSDADYMLFLGYTGIILLAAFENLKPRPSHDYLAMWGFHDGDLFYLCRQVKNKYRRIVKL